MVETDVEHRAGEADPHGHTRCAGCGYRWPCPDEKSKVPEPTDDERAVVSMVGLGWVIGGRDSIPELKRGPGTVIDYHDDDDGRRVYRLVMFRGGGPPHYFDLAAADVDPGYSALPNIATLRAHARRLARYVGAHKGVADSYELRDLEAATNLMRQAV